MTTDLRPRNPEDQSRDNVIELRFLREQLRRSGQIPAELPLPGGGGGGTSDGMEPRIAKLEAAVEHIQSDVNDVKAEIRTLRSDARTDFRTLFGAIIAAALGLAGLMAKGFHWL